MKSLSQLLGILLVLAFAGCAAVQTRLRPEPPGESARLSALLRATAPPFRSSYLQWLDYAERADLSREARLQAWLETARAAFQPAWQGETEAAEIYRRAVRKVVESWQERAWQPLPLPALAGTNRINRLEFSWRGLAGIDPRRAAELLAASRIEVRGLHQRATTPGFGGPFVARFAADDPSLRGQPGVPNMGMVFPCNAVLLFSGSTATLRFTDTLRISQISWRGVEQPLATDDSAALAWLISQGRNKLMDLSALFFSDRKLSEARLLQFQPYDPKKIPVVFVHGLMSRPEIWTQAVNGLLADAVIRQRYQFWFYSYPTGLPVWKSAAILRKELRRFDRELGRDRQRGSRDKILIGHSMGGLISSLMVREGGERLWSQFSARPFGEVPLTPSVRAQIEELLFFGPREDVARVIFVATPHRGSPMALRPVAGFFASLIRLPTVLPRQERLLLLQSLRDEMRTALVAPANSIRFLRADSPLLLSILELPVHNGLPLHSIIGNRGRRGPLERSSDGVVPYWSSHLPSVASEKVVPSGHGANEHPDGVEEIRRILREASPDAR